MVPQVKPFFHQGSSTWSYVVNVRSGAPPPPDDNGVRYLRILLDTL